MRLVVLLFGIFLILNTSRTEKTVIKNSIFYSVDEFRQYGIRFPELVLAQAVHETGIFKSKVFKENHNLFGMKYNSRGYAYTTKNGHAFYPHISHSGPCGWECYNLSLKDYKAWQDRFVPDTVTTVESYMAALQRKGYAEDPKYIPKVLSWYYFLKDVKYDKSLNDSL